MIVYPTGASAWAFLGNTLPEIADGALLRFVIRQPLPQDFASLDVSILKTADENLQRRSKIHDYIGSNPTQNDSDSISVVFRDLFQIDYSHLIAQNDPQKYPPANVFFLFFIPAGCENYEKDDEKRLALRNRVSREHDLFVDFLEANGAEVYSLQSEDSIEPANDGAWEYFVHNFKSGQIIVSPTMALTIASLNVSLVSRLLHSSRSGAASR